MTLLDMRIETHYELAQQVWDWLKLLQPGDEVCRKIRETPGPHLC